MTLPPSSKEDNPHAKTSSCLTSPGRRSMTTAAPRRLFTLAARPRTGSAPWDTSCVT